MKLHDVTVPKFIDFKCGVEKSVELHDGERLRIEAEDAHNNLLIVTFADCKDITTEGLRSLLMIDEAPDYVIFMGDNSPNVIKTVVDFFSDNFFGYGSVLSEKMKMVGIFSDVNKKNDLEERFPNKILDVTNEMLFFKSLTVSGTTDEDVEDKMYDCDILLQTNRPEWLTMPRPDAFRTEMKASRLKLLLHTDKERRARYYADFGICVKSCSGPEIFNLKV